jgi:hypothetical protein
MKNKIIKAFGKIEIEFYHDYSSFLPNVNWRDFTWIKLYTETNYYSKYLEIDFAILGLHFNLDWFRKL